MNVKPIIKSLERLARKRSPEILVAIGIVSMGSAVVFAIKDTPKAVKIIDEKTEEKGEELTPVEKVKATAKVYIPSAVAFTAGAACIIGASSIHLHRNAALAAAASLTDATFKSYRETVQEKIGKDAEKDISTEVAAKTMAQHPVDTTPVANRPVGDNTTWCFDPLSGRYFWSSINSIEKAVNLFNKQMRDEVRLSCNEWYDYLGIDHADLGDDSGWDIDRNGYLELSWGSKLDDKGTPTLVLVYTNPPKSLDW